jgi:L-glyceraldehyde 3-phosphate reductase
MNYIASKSRYSKMKYNRCGNSGLLLPAISLGLWHNFGHVDDFSKAKEMLFYAFDKGITHFDLANNYGTPPGSAEENLGKIVNKELAKYRDELIISSKAGYKMWDGPYGEWGSKKYLMSSIDRSLERLQLDYVDIFYSHRFDPNTPLEETMYALDLIVKQGKALYVGISNYSPENTLRAWEILDELNTPFIIHQPKYSMIDRWVEDDLLNVIEEKGLGCICYSPLEQGMLSDKYLNGIPQNSRAKNKHGFLQEDDVTSEKINIAQKLNKIAKRRNQTLSQMALAWIMKDSRITSVLIGVSSIEQLQDNIDFIYNTEFVQEELLEIDKILGK